MIFYFVLQIRNDLIFSVFNFCDFIIFLLVEDLIILIEFSLLLL